VKLYALHDKKAGSLTAFQVVKTDAAVTRDFQQAVLEPKSLIGKYPDDFELVAIAEVYDDTRSADTHQVEPIPRTVIITARQVLDLQPKGEAGVQLVKEA